MLRQPARALSAPSPLLSSAVFRRASRIQPFAQPIRSLASASTGKEQSTRHQSAHAVSNPTLANIEKRWEGMPPQEQAELWMALRDRMTQDWHELTMSEKKAGEFGHSRSIVELAEVPTVDFNAMTADPRPRSFNS